MKDKGEKPEHVTPEMAQLIKEVTDAITADEKRVKRWEEQRERDRRLWNARTEEQQQDLTEKGMEFSESAIPPQSKWVRAVRRKIRYALFRIRDGKHDYIPGLKAWVELQFRDGMTWATFTFTWDVSAAEPLKVIEPMEWDGNMLYDQGTKKKSCDPSAFTHQEM